MQCERSRALPTPARLLLRCLSFVPYARIIASVILNGVTVPTGRSMIVPLRTEHTW